MGVTVKACDSARYHRMSRCSSRHSMLEISDSPILVLYSTETGTSLQIANAIARSLRRIHLRANICDTSTYPLSSLILEDTVIFVLSTTGSGVPPRSFNALWKALLRPDLPEDFFDEMQYAVFGLGDSGYERFNWAAKMLDRRLKSLSAVELIERGEGDDQADMGFVTVISSFSLSYQIIVLNLRLNRGFNSCSKPY